MTTSVDVSPGPLRSGDAGTPEEMRRRRLAGETLETIGVAYGVTRERVRQILTRTYGTSYGSFSSGFRAAEREKQLLAYRESVLARLRSDVEPPTTQEVVSGAPFHGLSVVEIMGPYAWAVPTGRPERPERVSWEDAITRVREVWEQHVKPEPMSRQKYDDHRAPTDLSGSRLVQLGSWSTVCAAAGVSANEAPRATYARLSLDTAVSWVAAFLSETVVAGSRGNSQEYDAWSRISGAPSLGAVRIADPGPGGAKVSWRSVRAAAVRRLLQHWHDVGENVPWPRPSGDGSGVVSAGYPVETVQAWAAAISGGMTYADLEAVTGIPRATLRYHVTR